MNTRPFTPAGRLIVAADVDNPIKLATDIQGTGIIFKENVGLREAGYLTRMKEIRQLGFGYFADLKLNDISNTMKRDGKTLRAYRPDILTVMCNAPIKALKAIREELPETEILGVTVLTDITEEECREMYGRNIEEQVKYFIGRAAEAGLNGVICAPKEIPLVRRIAGTALTANTPGIRSASEPVKDDDQNLDRTRTAKEAFDMGAYRVVIGRPIVQASDPLKATRKFIEEIASALVT